MCQTVHQKPLLGMINSRNTNSNRSKMAQKFVRTENDSFIVFDESISHDEFKSFNPKSAGFIQFKTEENGNVVGTLYGGSISLRMESLPSDTKTFNWRFFNEF